MVSHTSAGASDALIRLSSVRAMRARLPESYLYSLHARSHHSSGVMQSSCGQPLQQSISGPPCSTTRARRHESSTPWKTRSFTGVRAQHVYKLRQLAKSDETRDASSPWGSRHT